MATDDGDIVRGVGYVSIYSAHAEKDVDDLLFMLNGGKPVSQKLHCKPTRVKIKHALTMVRSLASPELENLELVLAKADSLFVCRLNGSARNSQRRRHVRAQLTAMLPIRVQQLTRLPKMR